MILRSNNKPAVAVIGDGSWGTALTKIITENGFKVRWWMRNRDRARYIKAFGHNPHYLSSVHFVKRKIKPTVKISRAVDGAQYVLLTTPAAFIKNVLDQLPSNAFDDKIVISAIKGMIPEEKSLVTDYVKKKFNLSDEQVGIVSGPCHAEEIAMGRQSYLTTASSNIETATQIAELFDVRYVNVTPVNDLEGVEYSAIMKNIIAIASGVTYGLNFGDNFQAVLVSNAIQEIKTFLDEIKPAQRNLFASAYLGDLLVTSYSQFSRNRTFGTLIGRGYSIKAAMVEMRMVAEGYYAIKSINELMDKHELDLPICKAIHHIIYGKISPAIEFQLLKSKLQ